MNRLRKAAALLIALILMSALARAQDDSSESWRRQPPAPGPARPLLLPVAREVRFDNGLTLVLVEDHRAPLVSMFAGVPQTVRWQKTITGLTHQMTLVEATADLLTEGAGPAFAREVESLGAQMDSGGSVDYALVSGVVISENAERLLALFAAALMRPKFLADEVDLYKNSRIDRLKVERQEAETLVREQFNHLVYGAHPYGFSAPTPAAVQALSRARIEQFYRATYAPAGTIVIVVGDFDAARFEAGARATLGRWLPARPAPATAGPAAATGGQAHNRAARTSRRANAVEHINPLAVINPPPMPVAPQKPPAMRRIYLIDRPGATQSDFRIGNLALGRADADYFALLVANTILGDGTSSRLFLNLREQQGFAYDVSSAMSALKNGGTFFGRAQSRTEVTAAAIRVMLAEFEQLKSAPVAAADLQNAKNYLSGLFSLSLATQGGIADELLTMKLAGLGEDHLKNYRARLDAVTAADVQRVARKYVHTDDATVVVVGDAARLRKDLAALGTVVPVNAKGRSKR